MNDVLMQELNIILTENVPYELKDEEKESIYQYFSRGKVLSDDLKKNILEINQTRINYEKNNLFLTKNNDDLKLTSLISFFSLASISPINNLPELTPIEKTLMIFPEIKEIYLITTNELIGRINDFATYIEEKYKVIIKSTVSVNANSFQNSYNKIKDIIIQNKINEENLLFDVTLGFKMTSLAFYKISIEDNIKSVSWQEIQAENTEGRLIRIPATNSFYFIDNPKLENITLYKNIDDAILSYDFKTVSCLYSIINQSEYSCIYNLLSFVFTFVNSGDFYSFTKRIDNLFIKLEAIKIDDKKIVRFKKILLILDNLRINLKKNYDNAILDIDDFFESSIWREYQIKEGVNSTFYSKQKKLDNMILFNNEIEQRILFFYIEAQVFTTKINNSLDEFKNYLEIIFDEKRENGIFNDLIFEHDLSEDLYNNFKVSINNFDSLEDALSSYYDFLKELIFDNENSSDLILSLFKNENFLLKDLLELTDTEVKLTEEKFYINKFNIVIDLDKENDLHKKLNRSNRMALQIKYLLNQKNYETSNFMVLAGKDDDCEYVQLSDEKLKDNAKRKQWSEFLKFINDINILLREYFERNTFYELKKEDFIKLDELPGERNGLSNYKKHRLYVNPYFLKKF